MFNIIQFLASLKGREVLIKTRHGIIKAVVKDVGRNGTLLVSNYRRISDDGEEIERMDTAIIRGDSIIAIVIS